MLVHADESCLGNQRQGASPGGAGALLEFRRGDRIARYDLRLASPNTTNNQMALHGAAAAVRAVDALRPDARIVFYSDSQYLVKGITEWAPGWERRGWRRKAGPVENLALWQALRALDRTHEVTWKWVRGHDGHLKNEYADHLAVSAASDQPAATAPQPSDLFTWLAEQQRRGRFVDDDADRDFLAHEQSTAA